jgi:hypothetical protein
MDIKFDGYGIKYPTNDGRTIKLGPGSIAGSMQMRFEHKEKELDIGSRDVIAADFRIPDSEGHVWLVTVRFTAELFLRHTLDLTVWHSGLFFLKDCRPEIRKSLDENILLQNILCGEDVKRTYRVCISNELVWLSFKYSQCTFDIAGHTPELLVVKINDYSISSDVEYVGNFAYLLPIDVLFKNNTAIYHTPIHLLNVKGAGQYWLDTTIPLPLYFEFTDGIGEPQSAATVENR